MIVLIEKSWQLKPWRRYIFTTMEKTNFTAVNLN
jgi:hypothetical protein